MPLKNGRLTYQERKVAEGMAMTGSQAFAQHHAGMSSGGVSLALQRPAVQAEIARQQVERLFTEALPAAVTCLVNLIQNEKAPAGARVQAAKVVMDRTLGRDDAEGGKAPHEMSGEELAKAIEELTRLAADKAMPVQAQRIDALEPDGGVFG